MCTTPVLYPALVVNLDTHADDVFFETSTQVKGAKEKTGGMLRIFASLNPADGMRGWHQVYSRRVGTQEDEATWSKYELISMEKALRLMKMRMLHDHVSSSQSRNPDHQEYNGSFIVTGLTMDDLGVKDDMRPVELLITFSGLPQDGDELFGIMVAEDHDWGDKEQYKRIAELSGNEPAKAYILTAPAMLLTE